MKRIAYFLAVSGLCIAGLGGYAFWHQFLRHTFREVLQPLTETTLSTGESLVTDSVPNQSAQPIQKPVLTESNIQDPVPIPVVKVASQSVLQEVPFTSQAPTGKWGDLVFQDGCEEASMMMAMAWAKGMKLSLEEVVIQNITQFETKKFGSFTADTSAEDTAQIMREYFAYDNISIARDVSIDDIRKFLDDGALVMAPMNGQALHNPHFTQPGPLHHMLVIIGYDAQTGEFITNDPGTKEGKGYRYSEEMLYRALRDYSTGNKALIAEGNKKTIIVIRK